MWFLPEAFFTFPYKLANCGNWAGRDDPWNIHACRISFLPSFQWVPAHCGISGNDPADAAAWAAVQSTSTVAIPLAPSDVNRCARVLGAHVKASLWARPDHSYARLQWIDPRLSFKAPSNHHRHHEMVLYRPRLGVALTRKYFHKIERSTIPNRLQCNVPETMAYVLIDYSVYKAERQDLERVLQSLDSRPSTEQKMLGHCNSSVKHCRATKALLNFLVDVYKEFACHV